MLVTDKKTAYKFKLRIQIGHLHTPHSSEIKKMQTEMPPPPHTHTSDRSNAKREFSHFKPLYN